MTKLISFLLLAMVLAAFSGCATQERGDREFIPGQGWVPVK